jgi:hypothetical protein
VDDRGARLKKAGPATPVEWTFFGFGATTNDL